MAKQEQPAAATPAVPPPVPQFRHNRKQVGSIVHCCQYHTLLSGCQADDVSSVLQKHVQRSAFD